MTANIGNLPIHSFAVTIRVAPHDQAYDPNLYLSNR